MYCQYEGAARVAGVQLFTYVPQKRLKINMAEIYQLARRRGRARKIESRGANEREIASMLDEATSTTDGLGSADPSGIVMHSLCYLGIFPSSIHHLIVFELIPKKTTSTYYCTVPNCLRYNSSKSAYQVFISCQYASGKTPSPNGGAELGPGSSVLASDATSAQSTALSYY